MYENGHRMSDVVHKKFEYFYYDFKLLAGLAMAAFTDWKLTLINAIPTIAKNGIIK